MKKNEVQKKIHFCARKLWRVLDVQYCCGILFWYNYWCPESLEYIRSLHSLYGRPLFQKMPKNRLWGILSEANCCSLMVQRKFFLKKNSICMDFICLQWLAARILSGRNIGAFRCYVEFSIRAKTGFSNISTNSNQTIFKTCFDITFPWPSKC